MHFKAFDPKNCLCYRKFNNKSFWNKRTKARLGQDFSVKEENHFFWKFDTSVKIQNSENT